MPGSSIKDWYSRMTTGNTTATAMKAMRIPTITGLHLPRRMGLLLLPFPPMVLKDFLEPMAFWFKNTLKEAMAMRIRDMANATRFCPFCMELYMVVDTV